MKRLIVLIAAAVFAGWSTPAQAGPVEENVDAAVEAITNGDFDTARNLLDIAEKAAPASQTVVLGSTLASIDYYRGMMEFFGGDRDQATLVYWRSALEKDITFAWDKGLVVDPDAEDLFEALRSEVDSRDQAEAAVPEDSTEFRVYVDGRMLSHYDAVVTGTHLVQVLCMGKGLTGAWHEFGEPPDYGKMCARMGAGGAAKDKEEKEKKDKEEKDKKEQEEKEKKDKEPKEGGVSVAKIGMIGGGVALVGGGVGTYFALYKPNYELFLDYDANPSTVTDAIADDIESKHNTYRFLTMGLWGAGALLAVTGAIVPLGSGDLRLVPMGNGLLLTGRF